MKKAWEVSLHTVSGLKFINHASLSLTHFVHQLYQFACCTPSLSEIFRWQLWFLFLLFSCPSPLDFRKFRRKFQSPDPQLSTDIQVPLTCSNSLLRRRPLVYFQTQRICERKIWPNFLCSQHPKLAKRCLFHGTRFDELSLLRLKMNCTKIMQAFVNRKRIKLFDTRSSAFHFFLPPENVHKTNSLR